ncbi:hypothetical protein fugu_015580 [Takifugu bimaculatus]|uniref:Major facilitator superfamily (MFS) profile domain-containing protein n=1 Tax=Takifugu bimaculatus TaxID=433685 RepID=A0A4Z2BZ81_9TELE|nr:hypothetical protein fugu_015580 [Takifugu bimaculatus]
MVLGLFVPPVFVVSYAKELGYEDTKSALLLTILGFIDIFARPLCGVIAGLKWVRPRCVYLFSFAMLFNGTTDLIGSQAKDYTTLVVFCIFFGVSYGMVGALAVRGSDGDCGHREVLQRHRPGPAYGGHCCAGGATWCRPPSGHHKEIHVCFPAGGLRGRPLRYSPGYLQLPVHQEVPNSSRHV